MDALALLCNLYGDGPATLKRLRSAGCDSFGVLEGLEPEQLAEILGTNEAAARRFLREARLLVERVTEGECEREERPPLVSAPARTAAPAPALPRRAPATVGARATRPASSVPAAPAGPMGLSRPFGDGVSDEGGDDESYPEEPGDELSSEGSTARDRTSGMDHSTELIDRVLATWRERDELGAERDVELCDYAEDEGEDEVEDQVEDQLEPEGTQLRARLIDGLDRALVESLLDADFRTLESLVEAEALAVSQAAGLELTRVMRLQFLARRRIAERAQLKEPSGGQDAAPERGGDPQVLQPAVKPWPLSGRPGSAEEPVQAHSAATLVPRPEAAPGATGGATGDARDPDGPKFSLTERPFGTATSELADELDRASQRLRRSDAEPGQPDEGTGGPFA